MLMRKTTKEVRDLELGDIVVGLGMVICIESEGYSRVVTFGTGHRLKFQMGAEILVEDL
jgi:hypothetical protein